MSQCCDSQLVGEIVRQLEPSPDYKHILHFDEHDPIEDSAIATFYAGRSVFITGATGFIGKAVVEKLLRSCRGIECIYVLIRCKRGKSIEQRAKDLINAKIFDNIRSQKNGLEYLTRKLRPIEGDITLPKFGIKQSDLSELSEKVSVVFNSAATIRFVEPLNLAIHKNIYSCEQLFELCNELNNLQALIHLSTAYSNCHKKDTIYEVFYEPPMRGEQMIDCVDKLKLCSERLHDYKYVGKGVQVDEQERSICEPQRFFGSDNYPIIADYHRCNSVKTDNNSSNNKTPISNGYGSKIIKNDITNNYNSDSYQSLLEMFTQLALRKSNRPNVYTLTKAVSESYILDLARRNSKRYLDKGSQVKVSILRPSIVGAAWREPRSGIVDNYNGPTGAILSLYTGVLQAMPGNGNGVADVVPVDIVVNCVIAIGWFLCDQQQQLLQSQPIGGGNGLIDNSSRQQALARHDQGIYLFNMVSGYRNPFKWKLITDKIAQVADRYPTKYMERLPGSYFIRSGWLFDVYDTIMHYCPAVLIDLLRWLIYGQPKRALSAYKRVKQMTDTLTPFTSNQWRLCDTNVRCLYESLSAKDRDLFNFDITSIDWSEYIVNYILGSRVYLLEDEPANVLVAKRQMNKMRTRNYALFSIIAFIVIYLMWL